MTQLFPNGHFKGGREGRILAGSPIVVPDDYYGIHFNATSPSSGTLIALVSNEPIELPAAVKTRSIEVIPREQAKQVFLPAIVAALDKPADAEKETATRGRLVGRDASLQDGQVRDFALVIAGMSRADQLKWRLP